MSLFFLLFGLIWLAGLAFWIWALIDCIQVPDDAMYQSGSKLVWVLVIVFLTLVGAILYVVIGRPRSTAPPRGSLPPPPGDAP